MDRWDAGHAALRRYIEARRSADPPRSVHVGGFPLGAWVSQIRADYWDATLDPDKIAVLEALPGWSWGPTLPTSWRAWYLAWTECSAETDLCDNYLEQCEPPLEQWARLQRDAFAAGTLHPYRTALLRELSFWVWDPGEHRWHHGLTLLTGYAAEHGTADIPRSLRTSDGFALGQWVNRCREDLRSGRLAEHRIGALEALPGWRWGGADGSWRTGMAALRRFVDKNGHASPGQHYVDADGLRLGLWVAHRRKEFRAGRLTPDKVTELESLPGWMWNPMQQRWEQGMAALEAYRAAHGHTRVPRAEVLDGYPVGEWVHTRRQQYQRHTLPAERIAELEALPGWQWRIRPGP
ncbi:helicase associated domain-containing protein [Rhodococcus artemisiae]|uniref:Helicase associated domain-containing protein n=1 Tax=Rhodococcus artemisiae TaxID=714159 RepID=A0ABU7LJP3_9NOCA|nr:helicase associated domain-containing protein [Rhodococcus artemisiae]MEE2061779.1 helicase associated domain-containing protein [Rhodococcus artemisiae]